MKRSAEEYTQRAAIMLNYHELLLSLRIIIRIWFDRGRVLCVDTAKTKIMHCSKFRMRILFTKCMSYDPERDRGEGGGGVQQQERHKAKSKSEKNVHINCDHKHCRRYGNCSLVSKQRVVLSLGLS